MIIRRIVGTKEIKRVAVYARVSTLNEAQEESFETQVDYYKRLINATDGWELAGIYADQGFSGIKAKKRPQFMNMIQEAKNGRMDIILCKSLSRFSRNAGEALIYIHELKDNNVEVRFEKEGINTFDSSSDFILGLYAALAQEESRSISENVKWSYRRLAEQGIRHVGNNHLLGYDEVDGKLTPNKDAWIVKLIFEEYAAGIAPCIILAHLQENGAKRMRSQRPFICSSLYSILKNEAYVGNRLIQKSPPRNYLTKKPDPIELFESKYIYNDHESIISQDIWDAVQERMRQAEQTRERGLFIRYTSHFLYGKVFCAKCGEPYRRFTATRVSGKYKTWRCRGHAKGSGCQCRHIQEIELLNEIKQQMGWNVIDELVFVDSIEKVLVHKDRIEIIQNAHPK